MRHYVMIRASYARADMSGRRLVYTGAITVPSLAAQSDKNFEVIVRLHPGDPYMKERKVVFERIGVPVSYLYGASRVNLNDGSALSPDWRDAVGPRDDTILQTRLDDDDALAATFMSRLHRRARKQGFRCVYTFPVGYVAVGDTIVWREYEGNQFPTLQTPPGDGAAVYDWTHNELARSVDLIAVDRQPAWLWVRHEDAISVLQGKSYRSGNPSTPKARALFPGVDWSLVEKRVPANSFATIPVRGDRRGHAWGDKLRRDAERREGPSYHEQRSLVRVP